MGYSLSLLAMHQASTLDPYTVSNIRWVSPQGNESEISKCISKRVTGCKAVLS